MRLKRWQARKHTKKGEKEMGKLYVSVCKHRDGTITYSVCEYHDWLWSDQLTPDFATEAEARAELEKMQKGRKVEKTESPRKEKRK
jgi:hypothetical protein